MTTINITKELDERCYAAEQRAKELERVCAMALEALDQIAWNRKLGERAGKQIEALERIALDSSEKIRKAIGEKHE